MKFGLYIIRILTNGCNRSDVEEEVGGDNADNNKDKKNNNMEEGEEGRAEVDDNNGDNRGEYGGQQGKDYESNIDPADLIGAASKSVLAVATARTFRAGSTSSSATTSGDKWSSSDNLNGEGEKSKKCRGFRQPLQIPWRGSWLLRVMRVIVTGSLLVG